MVVRLRWLLVVVAAAAALAVLPEPATAPGAWCASQNLVMFCDDFNPPRPGWTQAGNGAQTGTGSTAGGFAYNPNDWHQSSNGCTDGGAKYVGVNVNGEDAGYLSPQPFGLFLGLPPNWYQVENTLTSPLIDARGIQLQDISFKLKGSSEGTSNPPFDYLDVYANVLGGPSYYYGRYSGNQYQDPCFTFTFSAANLGNTQFRFEAIFTQDSNTDSIYVVPCTPTACLPMDTLPPSVVCNAVLSGGCLYGGMGWYVDDVLVRRYNTPPSARFNVNATVDCLTKDFRDMSTDIDGTVVAWHWDFGDATSSVVQHPTHTYALEGSYLVILNVTDAEGGRGSTSQTVEVRCPPPPPPPPPPLPPLPPPPPIASFTMSASQPGGAGCGPVTVTFTDTSTPVSGPIVAWYWEFGDGQTSIAQNPVHTYYEGGVYLVTLIVTDVNPGSAAHSRGLTIPATGDCHRSIQGPVEPGRAPGQPRDGVDAELAGLDSDSDGIPDYDDSCPSVGNAGFDADQDGRDDACDADIDGDGILNGADLCPATPDALQRDHDLDGLGDACDSDVPISDTPEAALQVPPPAKARVLADVELAAAPKGVAMAEPTANAQPGLGSMLLAPAAILLVLFALLWRRRRKEE